MLDTGYWILDIGCLSMISWHSSLLLVHSSLLFLHCSFFIRAPPPTPPHSFNEQEIIIHPGRGGFMPPHFVYNNVTTTWSLLNPLYNLLTSIFHPPSSILKSSNLQIFKSSNLQILKSSNLQIAFYPNLPVMYSSVCFFSGLVNIFLVLPNSTSSPR